MTRQFFCKRTTFPSAGLWAPAISGVSLPGSGAPVRVTFSSAHGLVTGSEFDLSGTTGVSGLNARWVVTRISSTIVDLDNSGALTGSPAGSPAASLAALDISGITKAWTLRIKTKGAGVLAFEDTVDNFSASERRYTFSCVDSAEGIDQLVDSVGWEGNDRFGTASAKLRARLVAGTNVEVTAWVEYP